MRMTEIYLLNINEAKKASEEYCKAHFPERFSRAGRFKFEEDRLRSISAGILISEVLGIDEADILIGGLGKPYSDAISKRFSISHSGDYSVLALSGDEVGVDIEKIDPRHTSVAGKVLTEREFNWMDGSDSNFFKLWTLKESLSKAVGKGLALPFETVDGLALLMGDAVAVDDCRYFGQNFELDGYMLSVCTRNNFPNAEVKFFQTVDTGF